MTTETHPRPNTGCTRAFLVAPSCARAYREESDMNLRPLAAAAALTLCVAAPADARHVTPAVIKARIMDVFGPAAGPHAIAIARCESTFDPHATHRNRNGTTDYGVFQLNSGGTMQGLGLTAAEALDWEQNIAAAYRLYRQRGWRPWVCSGRRR